MKGLWLSFWAAMSLLHCFSLIGFSAVVLSCAQVSPKSSPVKGDAGFNPLGAPGVELEPLEGDRVANSPFQPGEWAESSVDRATFFETIPEGNARASQVLAIRTPVKIVSVSGTFLKVELDSGEVGFVPAFMLSKRSSTAPIIIEPPVSGVPPQLIAPPPVPPVVPGISDLNRGATSP